MLKSLTVVLVLSCVGFAEQIDNPEYQMWAKFSVGAYVKMTQAMEMPQMKTETQMTMTLKSLTAERAVVATSAVQIVSGQRVESPETSRDIPAKIDKPKVPPPDPKAPAPKVDTRQGEEEVEIAGTKVKCHWVEATTEANGQKVVSKTWTSDQVPGWSVKSEMTTHAMSTKTWVTEFKK